jgi:hypothetical protein
LFECFSDIKSEAPFDRKKKRKTRKNKKKIAKKSFFLSVFLFSLVARVCAVCGCPLSRGASRGLVRGRTVRGRPSPSERPTQKRQILDFFSSSAKKTIFSTLFFFPSQPIFSVSLLHLVLLCGVPACAAEGHR